jgi:hypothetical protein
MMLIVALSRHFSRAYRDENVKTYCKANITKMIQETLLCR